MRIISLENHSTDWEVLYKKEISIITKFLADELIAAHHIGSTAVPGLKAKPIIDILLEVKSIKRLDSYDNYFENNGYEVKGEFGINDRRFYQKGGDHRTHHIHAFEKGNPELDRHIRFRDCLIKNKEKAKEYENLKVALVKRYACDPDSYSKGKEEFICSIVNYG